MTKELVISANRHETRVAVLEDDQLVEIYFQRANEYSLAGSIHKGRVTRVLPGMQSAFVDLGLDRDTFLYVSDFFEESDEYEKLPPAEERPSGGRRGREGREPREGREGREAREGRDGRDRRDRDRREVVVEAAPVLPAEPVAESITEAALAAPEPVAKPEGESAVDERPVRADRSERDRGDRERAGDRDRADRDRGDRDRRNRRGRRRRGRGGRGFPDSKYAETKQAASPSDSDAEPGAPSIEDDADIIVLPGESLAKYSRHSGPEDIEADAADLDAEDNEIAETGEEGLPIDDDAVLDRVESAELEAEHVGEHAGPAAPEPALDEDSLDDDDLVAGSASEPADEEDAETVELAPRDSERAIDPVIDPASGLTEEQLDQIQQQAEAALSSGAVTLDVPALEEEAGEDETSAEETSEGDSVEDDDLLPEVGDEADDTDEAEDAEDAEEAEEAEEAEPGTAPDAPAQPALNADGTVAEPPLASIESMASSHREQTSRYLRGGRRMRRRRGGDRGERGDRPERADRPERPDRPERGERGQRNQRTAEAGSEERPPRVERQERSDRGAAPAEQVRTVSRDAAASARPVKDKAQPSITDLLKEGQEIVVQIAKEPLGQKGARITSHVALPGRYCVYMPTVEHLGVSRKIASDEERQRLRRILQTHRQGIPGGFIIRTAGEGKSEDQIAADIQYLYQLWTEIKTKSDTHRAPALLYHDVEVVQRLLRDQLTENFKAIWVDNAELYETVVRFVQRMQPQMVSRIKLYTRPVPVFDAFSVTSELEKALRPKVWLKSGGYIVINQTEALVAIDVNTGKFVGKSNRLEDTIVKTNIDAVKEIVRQIRLRDLGGIIVVDFIDMDERKNRQKVMQALEEAMKTDRAPNKILQFNDFGLVAITRKRVKQSLERALCSPCPTCDGSGYVKSVNTVVSDIMIEAQKMAPHVEAREVVLRVHPSVAVAMKSKDTNYLEELEDLFGRPVLVKGDDSLHPEKYDIA
ncbi:MAG: Rne/Rng family ribonuclease [Bryobacterales bacterium]|nr:Rne/Rng family ribonuclease [Bryobacterales bacterium]